MAGRSLARLLAPVAIVACAVAFFVVVSPALRGEETSQGGADTARRQATSEGEEAAQPSRTARPRGRRSYTVQPGDTLSVIAERTNVSQSRIEELNPDVDPQTLSPGTRIRLRR